MKKVIACGLVLSAAALAPAASAQPAKPTVVLVHGAFADSSSWNGVITILERDGYSVVAAPNMLRGVRADADVVRDLITSIRGSVVLVGHSYGGSVISEAAEAAPNVKALVYVSAFAPDAGEPALSYPDPLFLLGSRRAELAFLGGAKRRVEAARPPPDLQVAVSSREALGSSSKLI